MACLWPEFVADCSYALVEQHAASGTFQQLEESAWTLFDTLVRQ